MNFVLTACGLLLLRNIVETGSFGGEADGGGGLLGGFGDISRDSRLEPDSGSGDDGFVVHVLSD